MAANRQAHVRPEQRSANFSARLEAVAVAVAAIDGILLPLHVAVPGRARLRVRGLRRSMVLERALEASLPGRAGIRSASASARTGSLLVRFDPRGSLDEVLRAVEELVADLASAAPAHRAGSLRGRPSLAALLRVGASSPGRATRWSAGPPRSEEMDPPQARVRRPKPELAADPVDPWHLREADAALLRFGTSPERGLASDQVAALLESFGPNTLPRPQPRSPLAIMADQVETLPVAMLAASAAVALLTGGVADALVIGSVVLLNAAIGYVTESQSEKTIRLLTGFRPASARVIRDGAVRTVPGEEVVPGDLLVLGSGTPIVADARLLRTKRLVVDESALTGESVPVAKSPVRVERDDTPLGDRTNMIYRGTLVTGGSGVGVVVGTGTATEIGRIQRLAGEARPPETPSQQQLRTLGNQLVAAGGAVCGAMFAVGTWRGLGILSMLRSAISLAVASLPEGLPTIATTTLALGVRDLRRHRVLVRHIGAVETLGSVQVLCLDKTGTITWNRMTAMAVCAEGQRFPIEDSRLRWDRLDDARRATLERLIEASVLCNEAEVIETDGAHLLEGSPTERAFLSLALGSGIDAVAVRRRHPLVRLEHRSDQVNYMTSLHEAPGERRRLAVKGNPTEVLSLCKTIRRNGGVHPLTDADRSRIDAENGRMAGEALRVLGIAEAELPDDSLSWSSGDGDALTWLGLVGLADPPRPGIGALLRRFHDAGIDTSMITGDQSATAYAIAKRIELARDGRLEILDSANMERVPPEVLATLAERVRVFSRVSPAHKLEIVQALQRAGKVVAMTGDGINDGPALKAADVGIAMGVNGSEIARTVADIVLERDDLDTLVDAVRRGRTIRENTRKAIHYLLSSNLSEILVMFGGVASGRSGPLSPMQLLWLNLMTDVLPGLGLAVEPPDPEVLERPSRDPHEPLLRRADYWRIGIEGTLLASGALAAWARALRRHGPGRAAGTVAFMTLTTGQLLHAFSCRSETRSLFDRTWSPFNWPLKAAVGGSLALQLATPFVPGLSGVLGLSRIGASDALAIAVGASLPLLAHEGLKKLGFWARDERPSVPADVS